MSTGYTLRIRDLNAKANKSNIGVLLGRACIERDISVSEVAKRMGVTRATVYNWFCGVSTPQDSVTEAIRSYIASLE